VASLEQRATVLGIESAHYVERTHFPLTVTVLPGVDLGIKIGFDSARFEGAAIEQMLGHLRTVLEAMALEPDRRVADLPLMTENEQAQLIGPWQPSQGELLLDNLHVDQFTESQLDALIDRLR
jgi:surfactin family lipopeptide synthetase C